MTIGDVLTHLSHTITARREADPAKSYTASLLQAGATQCAKKFGEEAVETALAGVGESTAHLASEAADVLYHLLVLLAVRGVSLDQVAAELVQRSGQSGHDEKKARGADVER